jgi:hypothetical protein
MMEMNKLEKMFSFGLYGNITVVRYFMKTFITILAILFVTSLFSQNADIKKSWVGNDLEFIKVDSQRVYFEVFGKYPEEKRYYLIGDTLRLYDKYTTSEDNFSKQHIKNYDFLIDELTNANLTLTSLDSNSLQLTRGKKRINYRDRHLVQKASINLEMIKFNSTTCFGKCPSLTLQISKDKKLLFIGRSYAVRQGFYTSTLSDRLYNTLVDILELSELDSLKMWNQVVFDAPEFTLVVHYNGKVKYLKSYFLPAVTDELIRYLLDLPKKVVLEETKPFEISIATK